LTLSPDRVRRALASENGVKHEIETPNF
jgi:hypothetical protein